MFNPVIPLDPRGEGVSDIFDRNTHQPSASDSLDEDLFSRRNQQVGTKPRVAHPSRSLAMV